MTRWDPALRGNMLQLQHEHVVDDVTGNVRRMVELCGFDF